MTSAGWSNPRGHGGFAVVLSLLASLCWGCGSCGAKVERVGGETPYARCLAGPVPDEFTRSVGKLSLALEERALRIRGLPTAFDVAAFTGPGSGPAPRAELVERLAKSGVSFALALGDLGDDPTTAGETSSALARLPFPTLVVAGGRDAPARVATAIDAAGEGRVRIVDVTALREVRVGDVTLVPVGGAAGGRYALDDGACGHGLDDLKAIAEALGSARKGERRWLLSWHAPSGPGPFAVARTEQGLDVGSADLAELGRRIGALGGLFAWPRVQVLRPGAQGGQVELSLGQTATDLRLVVPSLGGAASERSDGSRTLPGFVVLRVSEAGIALTRIEISGRIPLDK